MRLHHEAEASFRATGLHTQQAAEPVLERLSECFEIKWFREVEPRIWLAIMKPLEEVGIAFGFRGECLVIGNGYPDDFFQRTLRNEPPIAEQDRLDRSVTFVASNAPTAPAFCAAYAQKNKRAVVLLRSADLLVSSGDLFSFLGKHLWRRDFFAESEPVHDSSEFFGREQDANELLAKVLTGSPFAVFGLRKIGKTSLLRRLEDLVVADRSAVPAVAFLMGNSSKYKSGRWWNVAVDAISAWQAALQKISDANGLRVIPKAGRLRESVARRIIDQSVLASELEKDIVALIKSARAIAGQLGREDVRLVLILDECDHLYPHLRNPGHWRSDFFTFWNDLQAIKRRLERPDEFVFILSGVNPSGVERGELEDEPNPLYELQRHFLLPMDAYEARSLLVGIGSRMGLVFSESAAMRAFELVGGHPLLLRRMGTAVHEAYRERAKLQDISPQDIDRAFHKRKKDFFSQIQWILEHLAKVAPDEEKLLRDVATGGVQGYADYWGNNDFRETYAYHLEQYGLLKFTDDLPEVALPLVRAALKAPAATEFAEQKRQLKILVEEIEKAVRVRICADLCADALESEVIGDIVTSIPGEAKTRALGREELRELGEMAGVSAVLDALNWGDYEILLSKFYDRIDWVGAEIERSIRIQQISQLFADSHLVRHNNEHGLRKLISDVGFDVLVKRFSEIREMLSA